MRAASKELGAERRHTWRGGGGSATLRARMLATGGSKGTRGYGTSGAATYATLPGSASGSSEEAEAEEAPPPHTSSPELLIALDPTQISQATRVAQGAKGDSPEARLLLARLNALDRLKALPTVFAGKLRNLLDRVDLPPLGHSVDLLKHDLVQLWGSRGGCIMVCLGVAFCALMGMVGALVKVTHDSYCTRLVAHAYGAKSFNYTVTVPLWMGGGGNFPDPDNYPDTFPPWTPFSPFFNGFPPYDSHENPTKGRPTQVFVNHGYPLGSVEVLAFGASLSLAKFSQTRMTVEAIFFAVEQGDLPSAAALNASLVSATEYIAGPCLDPGLYPGVDCGGYSKVTITVAPPANAASKCLGVRLRITLPVYFVQLNVTSTSAAVNITGNLEELESLTPSLYSVNVATDSAPVVLYNVFADARAAAFSLLAYNNSLVPPLSNADYIAPLTLAPSVTGTSNSGSLLLSNVFASGVYGRSGGNVRFASVASVCIPGGYRDGVSLCGGVEGLSLGTGTMGVSNLLAGRYASFSAEYGKVVVANVAALLGTTLDVRSGWGNVYLSNLLQGAGNETRVSTRGNVAVSATFVNSLSIATRDSGSVSLVALFAGIDSTARLAFELSPSVKLDLELAELFNPHLNGSYVLPKVAVSTDFGDVSGLSMGGNPQSSSFADVFSLDFRSIDGAIKLEVNGGGINADYTVSSGAASAIVELDGLAAPLTGHIGSAGSGNNSIFLRSERDNVQLSCEFWGGGCDVCCLCFSGLCALSPQ